MKIATLPCEGFLRFLNRAISRPVNGLATPELLLLKFELDPVTVIMLKF